MILRTLKKSSLWSFAVAILMAAQLALTFHHLQHKMNPDVTAQGEDCAVCQVASTMAPGPAAQPVMPPAINALLLRFSCIAAGPGQAAVVAGFRSRAPPISVSA